MTAKRFEYKNHKVYDNLTGETHSSNMVSVNMLNELHEENEQLRKENEKLESLWEDKCIKEYMGIVGEYALQEMHDEKYGDKE